MYNTPHVHYTLAHVHILNFSAILVTGTPTRSHSFAVTTKADRSLKCMGFMVSDLNGGQWCDVSNYRELPSIVSLVQTSV